MKKDKREATNAEINAENQAAPADSAKSGTVTEYFDKYYKAYKNDYISQYYKAYKEFKANQQTEEDGK